MYSCFFFFFTSSCLYSTVQSNLQYHENAGTVSAKVTGLHLVTYHNAKVKNTPALSTDSVKHIHTRTHSLFIQRCLQNSLVKHTYIDRASTCDYRLSRHTQIHINYSHKWFANCPFIQTRIHRTATDGCIIVHSYTHLRTHSAATNG